MAYEWAKPGVKVVCVETWINNLAGTDVDWANDVGPVSGQIYTIRKIGFLHPKYPNDICVLLDEIHNEPQPFLATYFESCFYINRFRPLITKKLPDSLTILLEKPNRLILGDGGKWDVKPREKVKLR